MVEAASKSYHSNNHPSTRVW